MYWTVANSHRKKGGFKVIQIGKGAYKFIAGSAFEVKYQVYIQFGTNDIKAAKQI